MGEVYNMIDGKTAIIILNYNSSSDTLKCIQSIRKHVKSEYMIVVVDNASKPEDIQLLKKCLVQSDNLKLVCLRDNEGYSAGNNAGINVAMEHNVQSILIMNPDVIVQNDIVTIMKKKFSEDVAWIGPRIYDIDGGNGQRIKWNYTFARAIWDKKPLYYLGKMLSLTCAKKYDVNKELIYYGCVSGCCFLIDAQVFSEIGFFDDNVFLYAEEYIIGNKLKHINKKTCYAPEAIIEHHEGKTTRKNSNAFIDYHLYASEYYYLKRYEHLTRMEANIIQFLRKINFKLKGIANSAYNERYKQFANKLHEIDKGDYKINC